MSVFVRKSLALLEDGGAVPWPHTSSVCAVVIRQKMLVVHDDFVSDLVGIGLGTFDQLVLQFHSSVDVHVGEGRRWDVAGLFF